MSQAAKILTGFYQYFFCMYTRTCDTWLQKNQGITFTQYRQAHPYKAVGAYAMNYVLLGIAVAAGVIVIKLSGL